LVSDCARQACLARLSGTAPWQEGAVRVWGSACAMEPQEAPDDAPEDIDPVDLVLGETVGTGKTAEVFRGTLRGQVVAIKELTKLRHMDAKDQVSFNREVSILARVAHPHLVQLHGVTWSSRPLRIVTEFCGGGTCFDLLHNTLKVKLDWNQRLKICYDVASGMDYLHCFTPQIIHRDLKSLNLLLQNPIRAVNDMPQVKVSDFGLSRMKDPDAAWGKMTNQVGTLHWMAPEVFLGSDYNEKADIYSYAMVLFEIICRDVPFRQEDPANIGRLTSKGVRPDLRVVPTHCPDMFRGLMIMCWAHTPAERPSFHRILAILREIHSTPGAPNEKVRKVPVTGLKMAQMTGSLVSL